MIMPNVDCWFMYTKYQKENIHLPKFRDKCQIRWPTQTKGTGRNIGKIDIFYLDYRFISKLLNSPIILSPTERNAEIGMEFVLSLVTMERLRAERSIFNRILSKCLLNMRHDTVRVVIKMGVLGKGSSVKDVQITRKTGYYIQFFNLDYFFGFYC